MSEREAFVNALLEVSREYARKYTPTDRQMVTITVPVETLHTLLASELLAVIDGVKDMPLAIQASGLLHLGIVLVEVEKATGEAFGPRSLLDGSPAH
jgi:hypothetical protein